MTALACRPVPRYKRVLAVDLGTRMGYAYGERLDGLAVGALNLESFGSLKASRLEAMGRFLREIIEREAPDEIVYEEVWGHGKGGVVAAHTYGNYQAVLMLEALRANQEPIGIGVQQAKKAATGNGNASKVAVLQVLRKAFPYLDLAGFDEADALALWLARLKKGREKT